MTKIVDVSILAEIMKDKSPSQYYLDKETGRFVEITTKIIDAFEDDYYEHLSSSEKETLKVLEEIYNGSDRYVQIPKLTEGDLINVIQEIIESLDEEDELREILSKIALSENIKKKINYLIQNYEGFYEIWKKFYSDYAIKKAKAWALSLGFEIYEPEI
ncbi:MAG: UPF0158 family protein [candidate division WOR-3 bacterium]|jgi:hypothetical protein